MKKSAIIYDKWLDTLGGGEMVALNVARTLKDSNWDVTIISGKPVEYELIQRRLGIDVTDIPIVHIWSDEQRLKQWCSGKDLFINTSFMDYTVGTAKRNIYYAHFPTETHNTLYSFILNKVFLPMFGKWIRPIEFINAPLNTTAIAGRICYKLGEHTSLAFSFLQPQKKITLRFTLFFRRFYSQVIADTSWRIENAKVQDLRVEVDHRTNVVHYSVDIIPKSQSVTLHLNRVGASLHIPEAEVYFLNPYLRPTFLPFKMYKKLYDIFQTRLRSGLFVYILQRVRSYDTIITHSDFVKDAVLKMWKRKAITVYPPVSTLTLTAGEIKQKKNHIISVGRFFVLGHGKRQDVMIQAFKELYDRGAKDWSLHLVGSVGDEPTSVEYLSQLRQMTAGYPIHFHLNKDKSEVEDRIRAAKIYWHAAGLGEKKAMKQEHFGISTVEAISAGCVPVLFDGGGSPEIIKATGLPQQEHLYHSHEELIQHTQRVMSKLNTYDLIDLSNRMRENFSVKRFQKQILGIAETPVSG